MSEGLGSDVLPAGIRSRFVPGINGLTMHVLEAGFDTPEAAHADRQTDLASCCSTAFPNSPSAGARSCCRWRQPATT